MQKLPCQSGHCMNYVSWHNFYIVRQKKMTANISWSFGTLTALFLNQLLALSPCGQVASDRRNYKTDKWLKSWVILASNWLTFHAVVLLCTYITSFCLDWFVESSITSNNMPHVVSWLVVVIKLDHETRRDRAQMRVEALWRLVDRPSVRLSVCWSISDWCNALVVALFCVRPSEDRSLNRLIATGPTWVLSGI